jgi:hypothetical protein
MTLSKTAELAIAYDNEISSFEGMILNSLALAFALNGLEVKGQTFTNDEILQVENDKAVVEAAIEYQKASIQTEKAIVIALVETAREQIKSMQTNSNITPKHISEVIRTSFGSFPGVMELLTEDLEDL